MSREPTRTIVRRAWKRRDLLTLAPLAGLGALAGGALWSQASLSTVERRRGTCQFCLMRCGVEGVVVDGELTKVEGDLSSKTRGFLCEHGFALREVVHSRERLRAPLLRRGDAFHEVTWSAALGEIGERLARLKASFGAERLAVQTGWPFVRHPLVGLLHRFVRAFGSPNLATVSSVCEASLRLGQALTVGSKYAPDVRGVKTLVVWGANPTVTAPPFAHLVAGKARSGTLIVVDPVKTSLAKEATLHLQVRPGSDGALALGLIRRVLELVELSAARRERLHGLDELRVACAPFDAERVERLTTITPALVEAAAQALAFSQPVGVWQGLGVEHHHTGVETIRSISALEVLCGRFELEPRQSMVSPPGERFHQEPLPALYRMRTMTPAPPPVASSPLGATQFPLFERYNREAHAETFPEAMRAGRLKALVLWGSNPFVTASSSLELREAAASLDLLVTVDPFFSESAQRSDVVLPACTFAERSALDGGRSMVDPVAGARDDYEILTGLAEACGLGTWFPWRTLEDALAAPSEAWMEQPGHRPHPEARPEFGTPTGKAELVSTVLEAEGLAGAPTGSVSDFRTERWPLFLVAGPRPRARINSQFGSSARIRARMPAPEALIHPEVAAKQSIRDGQRVSVVTDLGRVRFVARVTESVHRECVVVPAGWSEANVNELIDGRHRDPISGFPGFRSAACRLEPE